MDSAEAKKPSKLSDRLKTDILSETYPNTSTVAPRLSASKTRGSEDSQTKNKAGRKLPKAEANWRSDVTSSVTSIKDRMVALDSTNGTANPTLRQEKTVGVRCSVIGCPKTDPADSSSMATIMDSCSSSHIRITTDSDSNFRSMLTVSSLYSLRKACTGSFLAARSAGISPKMLPTPILTPKHSATVSQVTIGLTGV